jgi:hypothetical protein
MDNALDQIIVLDLDALCLRFLSNTKEPRHQCRELINLREEQAQVVPDLLQMFCAIHVFMYIIHLTQRSYSITLL